MRISDWSSDVCSSDLNSANVDQTASLSGGDSLINQSGAKNQANVSQGDDGSGATPINVSVIDQTGNSNLANVSQDTSTIAIQSDSYIGQSGSNNVADVTQVDDWQSSTITQSSDGNSATVVQGDATLALTDDSFGNTNTVNQGGTGSQVAEVTQIDIFNNSSVAQTSNVGEAYVTPDRKSVV